MASAEKRSGLGFSNQSPITTISTTVSRKIVDILCGQDDRTQIHQQASVLQLFLNSIVLPGGEEHKGKRHPGEVLSRFKSVHSIINRPWWRRVWVVQELLLSRNPVISCGGQFAATTNVMVGLSIIGIFYMCLQRAADSPSTSSAALELLKSITPFHQTSSVVSMHLDLITNLYLRTSARNLELYSDFWNGSMELARQPKHPILGIMYTLY